MEALCLAVPGTITSIDGKYGVIDYGGVSRRAELMLVPQAVIGDKVLVHAGFAISVLDEKAAEEIFRAVEETKLYE